ncbi:MAG: recombinase family protein [Pirellulales bacterium]
MDNVLEPLQKGKRQLVTELIMGVIDYDRSSEERRELAQKMIYAQLQLARAGYSTGGRAPYGFRRWLIKIDGTLVRQLQDGERVRMQGHHVVWMPGPDEELAIIHRILEMLETLPTSQVARKLTEEGIPTPDHNRTRTDNGIRHKTNGNWNQSTVNNIAHNPLLLAVVEYGRRAMGDQLRFTQDGPRELKEEDFNIDGKPKIIQNPIEARITAPAKFKPLVDHDKHQQLLKTLKERAGTQPGKPRSRDPKNNPLGCRVFDMNCSWTMYRVPYKDSSRYKCGLYQQSCGASCDHNHVDGQAATKFILSCIRQRLLTPQNMKQLENRILELASNSNIRTQNSTELNQMRSRLLDIEKQIEQATQNLARARSDEQYQAISSVFDQLTEHSKAVKKEITTLESLHDTTVDQKSAIESAINIIHQLPKIADESENHEVAKKLFDLLNVRLFLGFQSVQVKKRKLNKLSHGVVTFGSAPAPIDIYNGSTARKNVRTPTAIDAAGVNLEEISSKTTNNVVSSNREDKSLGNVSRGDRI